MVEELQARQLSITFGGVKAVTKVSFASESGKIIAIIGPNGAGKTTLFNIVTGLYKPDGGTLSFGLRDITETTATDRARMGIARTFQSVQIFPKQTMLENVMIGRTRWERTSIFADLFHWPTVIEQNRKSREKAREILNWCQLSEWESELAGAMAYGVLKRMEIARALASEPRVLLLDEPVAGCNAVETAEVSALLRSVAQTGVAIVLIEHDMKMVMSLSHHVLVLNHGVVLAQGTPERVRQEPEVVAAYLGSHTELIDDVEGI